jgi:CubicO group peptidase (beta-lactamase class C family)
MRIRPLAIPLFVASLCAAPPLAKIEPNQAGFSAQRLQRVHDYVQGVVDRKEFAGVNALISRKGKLAYFESFGEVKPDTIMRIASMTKPITSTAVMMLYEEGKFLLDDPVSKYIPGMDKVRVLTKEDGDGTETIELKSPMTIRHLLTHTSGLSNAKGWRAANMRAGTLKDMAAKLPSVPLATQPGSAWRYGDSIDVLGYLVELWSGKTFDAFLQERIFQPLGMVDTGFSVPADKVSRVAKIYSLNASGVVEPAKIGGDPTRKPNFLSGSGGLYSTAPDYLRFCQMLVNGGQFDNKRLLSAATVDYMMRNHVPLNVIPPNGPNGRKGYGFGIGGAVLMDAAAAETLSVDGEFNWGGATGTYFWIDRKNQLVGIWFVQRPPFVPEPGKRFKVLTYQAMEN